MAPKKRMTNGTVKCAFKKISELTPKEVVSVTAKIMSKSGAVTGKTGCTWTRLEIKDSKTGAVSNVKGWNKDAKVLTGLSFMVTYDFMGFDTESSEYGNGLEIKWTEGSSVRKSSTELDAEDVWDMSRT